VSAHFNYRHLYYFWVVAKEGGMARAAARLGMAVQTVSAQVRDLEKTLGRSLLKPAGRGLALTDAGVAAMHQADLIFQLGEQLPAVVREAADETAPRLNVGVGDGMPKLVVRRLLQPALAAPGLRLNCDEGSYDELSARLSLHRLDLVLADRPAPARAHCKLRSHALGSSPLAWYAAPALAEAAMKDFPHALAQLPVLLPTPQAATRLRLDLWFQQLGVQPRVAGEFADSALMKTFGAGGLGVFPAVEWVHEELVARYGVQRVGRCPDLHEHYHAIAAERKVPHPLLQTLLEASAPAAGPTG
jgi:LysR family transcriptional regulator, transcriptional activator of nhaA